MKIRTGFVSNSSSSSFIVSEKDIEKNIENGKIIENNFDKFLEKFNQEVKGYFDYLDYTEEEKNKKIQECFNENKELLEKQLNILKNIKKYLKEFTIEDFNNYFIDESSKNYYIRKRDTWIIDELWKKRPPFSAKLFYLAKKLYKINPKIYKDIFLRCSKSKYLLKNKRYVFHDVIWFECTHLDQFEWLLKKEYQLSEYENMILKDLIKNIEIELIKTYFKYLEKLKKELISKKFYTIEFQDGGGCGIYAPWLERELLPINYFFKINKH